MLPFHFKLRTRATTLAFQRFHTYFELQPAAAPQAHDGEVQEGQPAVQGKGFHQGISEIKPLSFVFVAQEGSFLFPRLGWGFLGVSTPMWPP